MELFGDVVKRTPQTICCASLVSTERSWEGAD